MIDKVIEAIQDGTENPNELVENVMGVRNALNHLMGFRGAARGTGMDFSQMRDIDRECQYPDPGELTAHRYQEFYDRFSIAARVVNIWPDECWKEFPEICETEDDSVTPFELSYEKLSESLSETTWLEGNQNPILKQCHDADRLRGIGHYAVVYIGLSDVQDKADLSKTVDASESLTVNFFRTFTEEQAEVVEYEAERGPRQNKPKMYHIDFQGVEEGASHQLPSESVNVHWSRVVHIPAPGVTRNEAFGTPRMRPVMNNLVDLRKLYGSSAEMYWQGAMPGVFFETHPSLGTNASLDEESIATKMQEMRQGLRRHAAIVGASANSLAPTVSDPSAQIDVQLTAICIVGGYPKRIFMGSEVGERSSVQDTLRWNGRVVGKQNNDVTPNVIAPVLDHLILLGILDEPDEGYKAKWPAMEVSSDVERMDVLLKKVEAFAKYVQGDVNSLIGEKDFLKRFVGMSQEEVEEVLDNIEEPLDEERLLREQQQHLRGEG